MATHRLNKYMRVAHNKIHWSDQELSFLKNNYDKFSNTDLAKSLNKTPKNIANTLKRLNLKKSNDARKTIKSKKNKERGRDLSKDNILNIAKNFSTRGEFYLRDPSAYSKALNKGWFDEACSHMEYVNISTPQLIMKDLLEFLLGEECSYNDRKVIKPLEIDCYFDRWKIGWEYDGKYYHNDLKDCNKRKVANSKGIVLFNITENVENFRNYEQSIKTQLILQMEEINKTTNRNICENKIWHHKINITLPNKLSIKEKSIVENKKLSEIKIIDPILYKRILRYKLYTDDSLNIKNDLKKRNTFKNFEEYEKYLIDKNYLSFSDLCDNEHPHRLLKKWNISIQKIHDICNKSTK